ncbi:MAG: CHASE2 domain-containing protein, partial [Verrucomicrobiae bacterium]|nr:CHASE2 domain-containing protein [Verrucomicrobiae bacterium]
MRRSPFFPLYIFLLLFTMGFLSRLGPFGEALFNFEFDYATVFSPLTKEPDPEFTEKASLIYLDEASHQELNQPDKASWDRSLHAKLINRLTRAGAELVYFDILFSQESEDPAADQALEEAIRNNGKVILIAQLTNTWSGGVFSEQAILPLGRFREAAAGWGMAALRESSDGAIRRMPVDLNETTLSGPKVAARFLKGEKPVEKAETSGNAYLRFYSDDPASLDNVWSYKQLLDDSVPDQRLKGKWFFIGVDQTIGFTGA